MPALNELCITENKGTQSTTRPLTHFLNYCKSNPGAEIIYINICMILTGESDTAYLVAAKARIRAAGYFYLGKNIVNFPMDQYSYWLN